MQRRHGRGPWRGADDWAAAWEGHHGRGRHGGRRGRMFDNGELRLILLHLLAEAPRHGYDLIRAIEELSAGAYVPSPGVVYPTLAVMRDMEWIDESGAENLRKPFSITDGGRHQLADNARLVKELLERLGAVAKVRERTDATPVRRAMQNLRTVLIDKLAGGADKKTVLQVVALIDEAAQKIERLGS